MTLEEAIVHCEEVAKDNLNRQDDKKCIKCGYEHLQLAEWLKELGAYRKSGGACEGGAEKGKDPQARKPDACQAG